VSPRRRHSRPQQLSPDESRRRRVPAALADVKHLEELAERFFAHLKQDLHALKVTLTIEEDDE
jgi:hypothetical protein